MKSRFLLGAHFQDKNLYNSEISKSTNQLYLAEMSTVGHNQVPSRMKARMQGMQGTRNDWGKVNLPVCVWGAHALNIVTNNGLSHSKNIKDYVVARIHGHVLLGNSRPRSFLSFWQTLALLCLKMAQNPSNFMLEKTTRPGPKLKHTCCPWSRLSVSSTSTSNSVSHIFKRILYSLAMFKPERSNAFSE